MLIEELPQGRKSRVEILEDGLSVKKVYNDNGKRAEKYRREVGFYSAYCSSPALPALIAACPDQYIVIERVHGDRLIDRDPPDDLAGFADDYVDRIVELFELSKHQAAIKARYFDGIGAVEVYAALIDDLSKLVVGEEAASLLSEIRSLVSRVEISEELVIKLDWNQENLFLRGNRVHKFIDFEQAFFGTREILVGVLLHNPLWPAARVFNRLRESSFFRLKAADILNYMAFSFAMVLTDSVGRSGKMWALPQLQTAYDRHVTSRFSEIMAA